MSEYVLLLAVLVGWRLLRSTFGFTAPDLNDTDFRDALKAACSPLSSGGASFGKNTLAMACFAFASIQVTR